MRESTSRNQANGSTPPRLHEAVKRHQHRRCRSAIVTAEERPVPPADGHRAVGPLSLAVVDLQIAVGKVPVQRLPLIERVTHRRPRRALGQHLRLDLEQSGMEPVHRWLGFLLPDRQSLAGVQSADPAFDSI